MWLTRQEAAAFSEHIFQKEFQPSGTPTRELSSRWSGFSTLREASLGWNLVSLGCVGSVVGWLVTLGPNALHAFVEVRRLGGLGERERERGVRALRVGSWVGTWITVARMRDELRRLLWSLQGSIITRWQLLSRNPKTIKSWEKAAQSGRA